MKQKPLKKSLRKWAVAGLIALIVLAIILGYGYYGGRESHSVTVICDIGWDRVLCWKWHQGNAIEILEALGAHL